MKCVIYICLFIGCIMIIDGIYNDEIKELRNKKEIEYKFIPRNMYEDMLYFQHPPTQHYFPHTSHYFSDTFLILF